MRRFLIFVLAAGLGLGLLLRTLPAQAQSTNPWSEPIRFSVSGWFPDIAVDNAGTVHLAWSQSMQVYANQVSIPTPMPTATPTPTLIPTFGASITNTVEISGSLAVTNTLPASQTATATPSPTAVLPTRSPTVTFTPTPTPIYEFDVVFYANSLDGQQWSEISDVAALESREVNVTRPMLWADASGYLNMAFRGYYIYYSHARLDRANTAQGWTPPYRISTENLGYFSALIEDHNHRLHLFYTENIQQLDCWSCYVLFHRYSDNQGLDWSRKTNVSQLKTGVAKPSVVVDPDNHLHVVWESGPGGTLGGVDIPVEILYTRSADGGLTWQAPFKFTHADQVMARNPALALDGQNRLVVTWLNLTDDQVYYSLSADQGQAWLEARAIPAVWGDHAIRNTRQNGFSMATDSNGDVHLVLSGRLTNTAETLSLLHLEWDQTRWSQAEVIADYPQGDAPEWPRAVVGNGNQLHVAWFVRPRDHVWDANPAFYSVWYARRTLDAPEIAPREFPTDTPTFTPIPPTATKTPTALPNIVWTPLSPEAMASVTQESDDLQIILISALPGVLITGLVLLASFQRRRVVW